MRILAVDDEKLALEALCDAIQKAAPEAQVCGYRYITEDITCQEGARCQVAFLDVEMRQDNGIDLGRRLKCANPGINIVFVTGYSEYAGDAFCLHASGYVMKPVTAEKIKRELDDLRHPMQTPGNAPLKVRAFGNFEVFFRGQPVRFQYNKTKELLAYLIDRRGASCPNGELTAILWGDEADAKARGSYLRNLKSDLISTLAEIGCEGIIVRQWGQLGILPEKISCDYYDWLNGKTGTDCTYRGEYMTQYGWGEWTIGCLESMRTIRQG